jgi:hypothetical protein
MKKEFIHITRDGNKIPLSQMTDSHLQNCINFILHRAKKGIIVEYGGGSCMEDIWYDVDTLKGKKALKFLNYDKYIEEQKRRLGTTKEKQQSEIVKRTEEICNEFDKRVQLVGWVIARLELAKTLAETESKLNK